MKTVHSDEDPSNECEVCGRKFTEKGNLSRHLRTVHRTDGPRYACEICDRKFTTNYSFKKHIRDVHSVMAPNTGSVKFAAISLHRRAA